MKTPQLMSIPKNKSCVKTQRKLERRVTEIQNLIKATQELLRTFNTI